MKNEKALILLMSALIGFTSLVLQTIGFEIVFLFFMNGHMAVGLTTSAFLLGMAFSSLLVSKIATKENCFRILIVLHTLNVLNTFLIITNYAQIPNFLELSSAWKPVIYWFFIFIPAFLTGGTFPIINGIYIKDVKEGIVGTGQVYFFDTLGAALGSLLTGLYLLPHLGLNSSILIAGLLNILFIACLVYRQGFKKLAASVVILCCVPVLAMQIKQDELIKYKERFGKVLFQKNSDYGVVTVGEKSNIKMLFINYRQMCNESKIANIDSNVVSSNLLARETAKNTKMNSTILNIGLGCGITARELANHAHVKKLDIVEINPIVEEAARSLFSKENDHVLEKTKVTLNIQDGAKFVKNTTNTYDAIVIDIEEVSVIYSSPLYTLEYMKIMKNKLVPNGTLSFWSFYPGADFAKVLENTAKAVFKNVKLQFLPESFNLYASDGELDINTPKINPDHYSRDVAKSNLKEINTLDNLNLEKYFNINKTFDLPTDYKEKHVRE